MPPAHPYLRSCHVPAMPDRPEAPRHGSDRISASVCICWQESGKSRHEKHFRLLTLQSPSRHPVLSHLQHLLLHACFSGYIMQIETYPDILSRILQQNLLHFAPYDHPILFMLRRRSVCSLPASHLYSVIFFVFCCMENFFLFLLLKRIKIRDKLISGCFKHIGTFFQSVIIGLGFSRF